MYYNRDHESVSKETLSVRIPGQESVKLLNDGQVMLLFSFVKLEYGLTGLGIQGRNEISKGKLCRSTSELRGRIKRLEAQTEELKGQIAPLLKSMRRQDNARFKTFHANTLVDFDKKIFVELGLDYPGNLEEVKDSKKNKVCAGGPITKPATARSLFWWGEWKTAWTEVL